MPLRPLPLYRWPLRRPGPHHLFPPLFEGRGVAGEVLGVSRKCSRASSFPSYCSCSRRERERRGGGGVVAVSGAVSADSSLTGGSAAIPCFPAVSYTRSPGPFGLLVCDSRSHSRSPEGLRREHTCSHSSRASQSSSGEARGEQCRDCSRLVGSRVRTRVSSSRSTSSSRSYGRDRSRRSSSHSPSVHSWSHRHQSRSSDRYQYCEVRSRSCGDCSLSQWERFRSSCRRRSPREHTPSRRGRNHLRSLDQSNLSPGLSRSRERYWRRWCKDHWEHGRHSSVSHVPGHCGSHLSARAASPSVSEPALRALANLLVGLTMAP